MFFVIELLMQFNGFIKMHLSGTADLFSGLTSFFTAVICIVISYPTAESSLSNEFMHILK